MKISTVCATIATAGLLAACAPSTTSTPRMASSAQDAWSAWEAKADQGFALKDLESAGIGVRTGAEGNAHNPDRIALDLRQLDQSLAIEDKVPMPPEPDIASSWRAALAAYHKEAVEAHAWQSAPSAGNLVLIEQSWTEADAAISRMLDQAANL